MCLYIFLCRGACALRGEYAIKELDTLGLPNLGVDEMGVVEVHCWVRPLLVSGCEVCADLICSHTAMASSGLVQLLVAHTLHAFVAC